MKRSKLNLVSKSENSTRLVIHKWTEQCYLLYGECGIYSVYEVGTNKCLYIGKSTDLGKRVLRFFKPRERRAHPHPFFPLLAPKPFPAQVQSADKITKTYYDVYLEITTISNRYKLDSFERLMIAVKQPEYNKLLKYNSHAVAL